MNLIVEFTEGKKAECVSVFDMRSVVNYCDYFVICSGNNDRHLSAIADGIMEGLHKQGFSYSFPSFTKSSGWLVLDIGDIVVHVFSKEQREFYGLEYLWQDAKKVAWKDDFGNDS